MFLIAAAAIVLGFLWFLSTPPARLAGQLRVLAIAALGAIAILSFVRGQLGLAMTFATLALGLLLRSNWAGRSGLSDGRAKASGQTSQVRTAYLEMELDTESGAVRGRILKGVFAGRDIKSMAPAELALLWHDCRLEDPQSAQIIETYLDRIHPSWREDLARAEAEVGHGGKMTANEAYDILGLKPGASEQDVRRAHRDLMKKMHPDRGGSSYLAAKINEAKALLLQGR